jgi:hypothetical protein
MIKLKSVLMSAAAAAAMAVAGSAKAAISYEYTTYTGSTAQTSYSTQAGTPITIPIYLFEALTNSSSSLITADGGLFGAGFSVTQTNNTGTGTVSSIAGSITTNGSNFPGGAAEPKSTNTSLTAALEDLPSTSATSGPNPNGSGDVQLGSITLSTTAPGTYTYKLANYKAPSNVGGFTETFGNGPGAPNGFDLDVTNTGADPYTGTLANQETFSVTVTPVPEPTSVALLGLSSLGLLARARRRKTA